jgi:LuxR family quorum sensing-dependent transcriptional regulator
MSSGSFRCGKDALDFIETLNRTSTVNEAVHAMQEVLARFGIEYFCLNSMPRPDQRFEEVMHAVELPPEWIALYLQEQYAQVSPMLRHCRRTSFPFEWKSAPFDHEKEPRAAEMVRRATDFGLSEGLCVPIHGGNGCEGRVWMGSSHGNIMPRDKALLHLIAIYAFDHVRGLSYTRRTPKAALTVREREVLTWVALGKSAWEIGEILNIAKRTVDEHAQTAFRKLKAVNRTQAVAIALREHMIEL